MRHSPLGYLLLFATLVTSSGASCRYLTRQPDSLAPVVFVGPPTLDDVIYAVNTNSAPVRQLYTESATLKAAGAPPLRATMALERPRRFRLRAKLIAQELDVGSNDELFWLWAKSDPERAIYFAYHEQFGASPLAQGLPIGPDWLIEALGLVQLDPAGAHEGPTARPDGKIEVRSRIERGGTAYTRLLVIDNKHGWIVEQYLWDMLGRNVATARALEHRFYAETGASLPHRVQIELPTVQLSFQLEVDRYLVNQLPGDATMWSLPPYEDHQRINIAAPPAQAVSSVPTVPAGGPSPLPYGARTAYRPRYRGLAPPSGVQ